MDEEFVKKFIGKECYIWLAGIADEWNDEIMAVDNGIVKTSGGTHIDCEMIVAILAEVDQNGS